MEEIIIGTIGGIISNDTKRSITAFLDPLMCDGSEIEEWLKKAMDERVDGGIHSLGNKSFSGEEKRKRKLIERVSLTQ